MVGHVPFLLPQGAYPEFYASIVAYSASTTTMSMACATSSTPSPMARRSPQSLNVTNGIDANSNDNCPFDADLFLTYAPSAVDYSMSSTEVNGALYTYGMHCDVVDILTAGNNPAPAPTLRACTNFGKAGKGATDGDYNTVISPIPSNLFSYAAITITGGAEKLSASASATATGSGASTTGAKTGFGSGAGLRAQQTQSQTTAKPSSRGAAGPRSTSLESMGLAAVAGVLVMLVFGCAVVL